MINRPVTGFHFPQWATHEEHVQKLHRAARDGRFSCVYCGHVVQLHVPKELSDAGAYALVRRNWPMHCDEYMQLHPSRTDFN